MNIIISRCELTKDGTKYYVGFTCTGDYGVSKYIDTLVDVAAARDYDDVIRIAYSNIESLITSIFAADNEKMPVTGKSLFEILPEAERELRNKLLEIKKPQVAGGSENFTPANEKKGDDKL
jgi:hypothetical protein